MALPGTVEIGADEVGIVRKKIGPRLSTGRHIALAEEAGFQADILPPGIHFGLFSWLCEVYKVKVINISHGEIGLVVAKDGASIPRERSLGRIVDCQDFQDARAFLENGGEKGQQLAILTAGAYRINTELFTIITSLNAVEHGMNPEELKVCTIEPGKIGLVTTYDGKPIPSGEIAGPCIGRHSNFQNGQRFFDGGGCNGFQEEVLPTGEWNLNPWFVKVEQIPITRIDAAKVGVIISHVGKISPNPCNEPVELGYKGIQKMPLLPGQYPINTRIMDVVIIPTYQITLDWSNKEKPRSNYDANLRAIEMHSKDKIDFKVEVTQVFRIKEEEAPKMLSRIGAPPTQMGNPEDVIDAGAPKFSSIRNLVVRVLEPMIVSHFQQSAQDCEAIEFHDKRSERQREAWDHIHKVLQTHGVEAIGTYINDIELPKELKEVLAERQMAKHRGDTYVEQAKAEDKRRVLVRAHEQAEAEKNLVEAETDEKVAEYQARAGVRRARGDAQALRLRLSAEIETLGGFENYLARLRVDNLARIQLPHVLVSSNGDRPGLMEAFLAPMLDSSTSQPHLLGSSISSSQPQLLAARSTETPQLKASALRYPIVLVLDTSSPMSEEYFEQLIQGINTFEQELSKDDTTRDCVEVAVITFGEPPRVLQNFTNASKFSIHQLESGGSASTGQGLERALKIIEHRKTLYSDQNLLCCPPWILLITGSIPGDTWQNVSQKINQSVASTQLNFLAVGVQGADMDILSQLSPPKFPPAMLEDLQFKPLFHGLAHQLKRVVSYQAKERLLQGLANAVEEAKSSLTPEQAEKLIESAAGLMAEASKDKPERKHYTPTVAELCDVARDAGKSGDPIMEILPHITKTLKLS